MGSTCNNKGLPGDNSLWPSKCVLSFSRMRVPWIYGLGAIVGRKFGVIRISKCLAQNNKTTFGPMYDSMFG
jgi:hypothetical protein